MPTETPERSGSSGYFPRGLPYNRTGRGPRPLVIFAGLTFEHKPQFGMLSMYSFLREEALRRAAPASGGADDFFYSPSLFRETAAGIPHARLCLYERIGHPAGGRQFRDDVLAFLRDDSEGRR